MTFLLIVLRILVKHWRAIILAIAALIVVKTAFDYKHKVEAIAYAHGSNDAIVKMRAAVAARDKLNRASEQAVAKSVNDFAATKAKLDADRHKVEQKAADAITHVLPNVVDHSCDISADVMIERNRIRALGPLN